MTKTEKKRFMKELTKNTLNAMIAKIDNIPEEWDGHELRELFSDHAQQSSYSLRQQKARYRNYKNETLVRNLV